MSQLSNGTHRAVLDVPNGTHRAQTFVAPRDGFLGIRLILNS